MLDITSVDPFLNKHV